MTERRRVGMQFASHLFEGCPWSGQHQRVPQCRSCAHLWVPDMPYCNRTGTVTNRHDTCAFHSAWHASSSLEPGCFDGFAIHEGSRSRVRTASDGCASGPHIMGIPHLYVHGER